MYEIKEIIDNGDGTHTAILGDWIKPKTGVECLLCGEFIENEPNPTICPSCRAVWKKIAREFSLKVGATVVATTKENDLIGFMGQVVQVRAGEALVDFPMVKGKRVITWLKEEDLAEVK